MRKNFVTAATVASFALLVTPASAKPGANGGKGRPGGSQEVVVAPGITVNEADPSYGDVVTFTATYPRMQDAALVSVCCWQGGVGVYHVAGVATDPFTLSGEFWTGGAAQCTADLYYYEWKGMVQTGPFDLTSTRFSVTA